MKLKNSDPDIYDIYLANVGAKDGYYKFTAFVKVEDFKLRFIRADGVGIGSAMRIDALSGDELNLVIEKTQVN